MTTFTKINGNSTKVKGDHLEIKGDDNEITGDHIIVNGDRNTVNLTGSDAILTGSENALVVRGGMTTYYSKKDNPCCILKSNYKGVKMDGKVLATAYSKKKQVIEGGRIVVDCGIAKQTSSGCGMIFNTFDGKPSKKRKITAFRKNK